MLGAVVTTVLILTSRLRGRMSCLRLVIISFILVLPAIAMGAELQRSAEQLAFQYKAAHDAGDYSRIEDLIYWVGVEQKMKEDTEKQIKLNFPIKIKRCYVTNSPAVFSANDYKVGNKTYGMNLTPIGSLHVEFESPNGFETVSFVGINDGKYFIILESLKLNDR